MINREKIKNMSSKELADFLANFVSCNICPFIMSSDECMKESENNSCTNVIRQWLEQEVEE